MAGVGDEDRKPLQLDPPVCLERAPHSWLGSWDHKACHHRVLFLKGSGDQIQILLINLIYYSICAFSLTDMCYFKKKIKKIKDGVTTYQ